MPKQPKPIIDWLSFTLPYGGDAGNSSFDWIIETFGAMSKPMKKGFRGYANAAVLDNRGLVGWTPARPENRIHVMLSSRALWGWQPASLVLIRDIIRIGGTFSRIDLAFDDLTGLLSMDEIRGCCLSGAVATRFRSWSSIDGYAVENDKDIHVEMIESGDFKGNVGRTIYIGRRISESFIRVYDKRAEVIAKHPDADPPPHWIRFEIETKKDRADRLAGALVDGHNPVGYARSLIDFKKPQPGDTRRDRWPLADWWLSFMGGHEKAPLVVPEGNPDWFEDMLSWLETQCSAAVYVAGELGYLDEILEKGKRRAAKKQRYLQVLKKTPLREIKVL